MSDTISRMARRWAALPVFAAVVAVPVAGASASGFALKEQSLSGLGNAYAGAPAVAQDASTLFFNPAGMTRLGTEALAGASFLQLKATIGNARATRAARLGGGAITGNASPGDATPEAVLPFAYGVWAVNPDLRLGLAVNSPWGLVTDYDDNWIGRYHAVHSELKTYNIAPSVAYKVNSMLSVGGAVQLQYAKAKLSNAVDFGSLMAAGGAAVAPGSADGMGRVTGDDWGVGFVAGVLLEPKDGTRFGLNFRSSVSHKLNGDATFSNVPAALAASFANTGATAKLQTPEVVSFGAYHELDKQWAVMGDVSWTHWSRFKELRIDFANPLRADSVTEQKWKNSWALSGGIAYKPIEAWTLRLGAAYDQSPVPDATRTPRIPDQDRFWLSAGAGYQFTPTIRVDAAYTHIFLDKATLALTDNLTGAGALRGNLSGTYKSSIDIVGVQVKATF